MDTQRFRMLTAANPPFASVYLDDSRDSAEAERDLDARWRELRGELEEGCRDERIIAEVAHALLHSEPAVGRRGRGVIATGDGVLVNEHLPHPPVSTVVRMSDYPYVLPLLDGVWRGVYIFAAVDHNGADITLHRGDIVRSESIDGGGYPVHNPSTAGWKGFNDHQRSTEEAVRMNVRATAERLTELVDKTDAEVVFVCGETRSRSDVVSALPRRVARRVSPWPGGALGRRIGENEARDHLDGEFQRRRANETVEIAETYLGERGRQSGLAVEGLAAVTAALREGCVDTLIVGDLADTTVVTGQSRITVAPDADTLSALGEPACRVARADEALPFAAIATDA
ncbi:MAG: Rv2629 family ribosome hibernation factor, partial [Mycobacterium sp.]